MMKRRFVHKLPLVLMPVLLVYAPATVSLTITENFSGTSTSNNWLLPLTGGGTKPNVACLTAGDNSNVGGASVAGSPPACTSNRDTTGKGALRLTPASTYMAGGIISDFTFPTNEGVEVSFTTYTYGGSGADGIAFFLTDGNEQVSFGAQGGSLGYSCANGGSKGHGILGGYLGLGIDEHGNFLNAGDNTNTGFGFRAGRIGLRGAGSINWATLNKKYPAYYPSSITNTGTRDSIVNSTCSTGKLYRYDNGSWINTGENILNYPALANGYINLPSSTPIGSSATTRTNARPINYKLRITQAGLLSLWWSYNGGTYQPILVDQDIVSTNGPLPDSFRFGFTGSTGAATNNHDITCFKAAPASRSDNSSAISLPNGEYKTGAQIYTTLYSPNNWWSQLTSNNLVYQSSGLIAVDPTANWDASCMLTGGVCDSTGGNTVTAQKPDDRQILTYNGTKGVPFRWDGGLTTAQQGYLATGDSRGELRLDYLRGDRTNELTSAGTGFFRARTSVLGDIINSSSAWVGPPTVYAGMGTWTDKLNTSATMPENTGTAQTYADFRNAYNDRLNVVYIGSNDGLLHGFRTGAYDSTGSQYQPTSTRPNDGLEVLAYMPASILKKIHNSSTTGLDYSSPHYGHNYFNDATPGTGDLFYGGKWHTWLISGLGFGGSGMYILDITDPTGSVNASKSFTESNADKLVVGEWSHDGSDPVWQYLGNTHGTPKIRRFHNGQWGAVFGNGWCLANDATNGNCTAPSSGKAGIYVMLVDENTGTPSFQFINTGSGSNASPNGIAYVTPADLDGDNIVDYVYAGDLQGNIWRFDLTSDTPTSWKTGSAITKVFNASGNQPITTQITVSSAKQTSGNGKPRVMINFGTGQQSPGYLTDADSYVEATQSLYGIWDWNLGDWNAKGSTQYAALSSGANPVTTSVLTAQTVNTTTNALSNHSICWAGQAACSGTSARYGWYMNMGTATQHSTTSYEQIIYNPIIAADAMLVNTYIPGAEQTVTCDVTEPSGFTYAIDPATGSGLPGFFTNNFTDTAGYRQPLSATGSPSIISVDGRLVMLTKNSKGEVTVTPVYVKPSDKYSKRVNWIQLR